MASGVRSRGGRRQAARGAGGPAARSLSGGEEHGIRQWGMTHLRTSNPLKPCAPPSRRRGATKLSVSHPVVPCSRKRLLVPQLIVSAITPEHKDLEKRGADVVLLIVFDL